MSNLSVQDSCLSKAAGFEVLVVDHTSFARLCTLHPNMKYHISKCWEGTHKRKISEVDKTTEVSEGSSSVHAILGRCSPSSVFGLMKVYKT